MYELVGPLSELMQFPDKPGKLFLASIWGMSFPWTLSAAAVAGVIIMCLPTWFGVDIKTWAADIGHLGGALIVTVSVISMGEVIRIGRYFNILLGLIVGLGPWFVSAGSTGYALTCSVLAVVAIGLSIPRGQITESYGEWDRYVR